MTCYCIVLLIKGDNYTTFFQKYWPIRICKHYHRVFIYNYLKGEKKTVLTDIRIIELLRNIDIHIGIILTGFHLVVNM